ncbi:MAG: intradiol ring-cleavage dioxygenase [Saprospiraceae bacterium]|nr:intradiol ring-cleavage dioxygenase [Saprospiraceae bacterium]
MYCILYDLTIILFCTSLSLCTSCAQVVMQPQAARLIGTCEGCEAIFEFGQKTLSAVDTLPDFDKKGQKVRVSGTVYQPDGTTPGAGVILYIYHTNPEGLYENKYQATNWERRHGYLRAWIKTDLDGKYTFYTRKPGVYPSRTEPAHIHLTVLEPNGGYYWVESYYFANDSLLTAKEIEPVAPRGGNNGILNLKNEGEIWTASRDLILGKNVAGYE